MSVLAPPPSPPHVGVGDNDGLKRFRLRMMQVTATTLTVLLQIYSYLAFTAARYPASVVEITGLTAPTF